MGALKRIFLMIFIICIWIGEVKSESAYDQFLTNPEFASQDKRLNEMYGKIRENLSPGERNWVTRDQRYWHKTYFPRELADAMRPGSPEEKALALIKERNAGLEKLLETGQPEKIMGLPLKFGETKKEVCEKLDIANTDICASLGSNDPASPPYTKKMFDEDHDIRFVFDKIELTDTEYPAKGVEPDFKPFAAFIEKMAHIPAGQPLFQLSVEKEAPFAATGSAQIEFLVGVSATLEGDMDTYSIYKALRDNFQKKYKKVVLDSGEFGPLDLEFGSDIYESPNWIIDLEHSAGSMASQYSLAYFSRNYVVNNLRNYLQIVERLTEIDKYQTSLSICPEFDSVKNIFLVFGDRKIRFMKNDFGYYSLSPTVLTTPSQFSSTPFTDEMDLYFTPENRIFGFVLPIANIDAPKDDQGRLSRNYIISLLEKKYKRAPDTWNLPIIDIRGGSTTNDEPCFESDINYMCVDFDRYMGSPIFEVFNKEEVAKFRALVVKRDGTPEEQAEKAARHQKELNREAEAF